MTPYVQYLQYSKGKIERSGLFHYKGNMRSTITSCHIYGASKVATYDARYLLPIVTKQSELLEKLRLKNPLCKFSCSNYHNPSINELCNFFLY